LRDIDNIEKLHRTQLHRTRRCMSRFDVSQKCGTARSGGSKLQ